MFPSQTEQSYTEDAGHTGWGGGGFLPSTGKQPALVPTSTVPPVVLQRTTSQKSAGAAPVTSLLPVCPYAPWARPGPSHLLLCGLQRALALATVKQSL